MANEINEENAPRLPDGSPVLVWYPPYGVDAHDRSAWAWLPGSIVSQCCSDEWCVVVEDPKLAEPDTSLPDGDAPENLLYPLCFRDSSEIRAVTIEEWTRVREAGGR
jgi:hypothetical protein